MSKLTIALMVFCVAAVSQLTAATPPAPSAKEVMIHHIGVIKKDDVEGIMQDYARNAVVVRPKEVFIGTARVRQFFEGLAAEHRDWMSFIVTQEVKEEGVVLQTEVKTGKVEVFVVRNGKIAFQTMEE